MAAVGDIYEAKVKYRNTDNKPQENVYFYRRGANAASITTSYSQYLAGYINSDVITPSLGVMPIGYTFYEVAVRNLFDLSDNYTLAISRATSLAGGGSELAPDFVSAKVTMQTDNGLVDKGRKMFSAIFETWIGNGLFNVGGIVQLAARAALILLQLGAAPIAGYVFQPVVVKRIRSGTPGNYTYRLPENQTEAVFGNIVAVVTSVINRHQVTRGN